MRPQDTRCVHSICAKVPQKITELKPGFRVTPKPARPSFTLPSALCSAAEPLPAPSLPHPLPPGPLAGEEGLRGTFRQGSLALSCCQLSRDHPVGSRGLLGSPYWAGGYSPSGPIPAAQPGLGPTVQGADCATGAHPGAPQPVSQAWTQPLGCGVF